MYREWPWNAALTESLGALAGKRVLELGCGLGKFSTYMAQQGADVLGVDISRDALIAARRIAAVNNVRCRFCLGDIAALPSGKGRFDMVVGVAVLHHLSKPDVRSTLRQVRDALRVGGKAVFLEPIENSQAFSFLQNLLPAGTRHSGYYRPSILSRKAWQVYLSEAEDRDMTTEELRDAGRIFTEIRLRGFGLWSRLDRLVTNERFVATLKAVDRFALGTFPWLERYARNILAVYTK